jgi:sigma-E factor negative regulatory protein RseA
MTDRIKEQLSAYLDGELPESELDLLLKQVSRDENLRASLGRYALISETIKAKGAVPAPASFSQRISAAISAEPPLVDKVAAPTERHHGPRWLRPAAGFAVAAGVAAVAILALQPTPQPGDAPYVVQASGDAPIVQSDVPNSASYIVPASTASSTALVPPARLTNYVVAHSEYSSSPLGRRSVLTGVLAEEDASDDESASDRAADAGDSEARDESQP